MQEVAYDHSGECPIMLGNSQAQNVETTINNVVETLVIKTEDNVKASSLEYDRYTINKIA